MVECLIKKNLKKIVRSPADKADEEPRVNLSSADQLTSRYGGPAGTSIQHHCGGITGIDSPTVRGSHALGSCVSLAH